MHRIGWQKRMRRRCLPRTVTETDGYPAYPSAFLHRKKENHRRSSDLKERANVYRHLLGNTDRRNERDAAEGTADNRRPYRVCAAM